MNDYCFSILPKLKALVTILMITCALNCLGQDNQGTKFLNADGSQRWLVVHIVDDIEEFNKKNNDE